MRFAPVKRTFAHVERLARDLGPVERADQGVDHGRPPVAGERSGSDVDIGVLPRGRGGGPRTLPTMVVRVDVEDHERAVVGEPVEQRQACVELVVDLERALDHRTRQGSLPDVEAPRVVGVVVDRAVAPD